ncbi:MULTISPECIES: hypothetical protein [Mesorhizobium]|uniref:Msl9091 protein n=1 Tax=Mesorhizobium japonicum (strain LMG 29417 / CECT 9101 / MAFF 303099) TaxID=266835 RepID=Q982G2_RHILO|nr:MULTISPECIES: hypothetical protein [Mesorhizobium]BAB54497.1 msl9091 [Mesorhizobium japonicum MAFF 303099]
MRPDDSGGPSVNLIAAAQTDRDQWATRHRRQPAFFQQRVTIAPLVLSSRHAEQWFKPDWIRRASFRYPAILLQSLKNGDINRVERQFS